MVQAGGGEEQIKGPPTVKPEGKIAATTHRSGEAEDKIQPLLFVSAPPGEGMLARAAREG